MFRSLGVCLCMALWLGGCVESPLPGGVVATVNGQPIALRTVETMLDTRTTGFGVQETPTLAHLRQQYGKALLSLISQVLIMQELERRGMGVSDAALAQAEHLIRMDYTEEEFEKIFIENVIDADAWREVMRYRIAMERFVSQVLRPTIYVPLEEIEAYYKAHTAGFSVPRTAVFWQLQSHDRAALERIRAVSPPPEDAPDIIIYRSSVAYEHVPPDWQKVIAALKPGEYTPVRAQTGFFEMLWLKESMPQRHLTLPEAYPYIEQILLEEKLESAFQEWLTKTLLNAQIQVSAHLASQVRGDAQ